MEKKQTRTRPAATRKGIDGLLRCAWLKDEQMQRYHDEEWGVPLHDDRGLFEFLLLGGVQAGLSWGTVLRKRENYREAFDGFDPEAIARYDSRRFKGLLHNPGIIRNRQKIAAAVRNARAFLALRQEFGSFDAYIWRFVGGVPRVNRWRALKQIPASTRESDAMSKDLRQRGFQFAGSTICYAFMQAAGMVNDHVVTCFRHEELRGLGARR